MDHSAKNFDDIHNQHDSVNYLYWIVLVFAWDGVLPTLVLSVPLIIKMFWPNEHDLRELAGIILPIVAFFVRLCAGMVHISRNDCSLAMRGWQMTVLFVAAVYLVMIDCLLMLMQEMPAVRERESVVLWVSLAFIYITLMGFAMYPGRRKA